MNEVTSESTADGEDWLTTEAKEMETGIQYHVEHPCHKRYMNNFPRRRLDECFVSNPNSFSE